MNALIIPAENGLSEAEKTEIETFERGGGKVYYYDVYVDSFKPASFSGRWYEAYEIIEECGKKIASVGEKKVDLKFLEDENEYAITVIDFAEDARAPENTEIVLEAETSGESCVFSDEEGDRTLPVISDGGKKKIIVDKLVNGGVIFIKKG